MKIFPYPALKKAGEATLHQTAIFKLNPAPESTGQNIWPFFKAVPVIESMGVPYLPLAGVLQREYLVPMVGGGSAGVVNINAMAGARITADNAEQLGAFEAAKVSGVTVNLRSVYNAGDNAFVAAVKTALAKAFDIDASKVKIIR